MRTTKTRIISMLMALVMSLSLVMTTAFAYDYSDLPDGTELIYGGGADGSEAIGCTTPDGKVYWFENAPFPSTEAELNELFGSPDTWDNEFPIVEDDPVFNDNDAFVDEDLALVTKFSDVKSGAWYYNDVTECAKLGIVAGFADGTFKPDDKVTDVQWITMVTRTFYNSDVETAQKSKPAGSPWYWANTKVATDKYLSSGVTINDKAMNRYDMARVTANVVNKINGGVNRPSDEDMNKVPSQVKDWSSVPKNRTAAIMTCYATGLIAGMSDGKFHGEQSMTRAQACTVIMRMLKLINKYNPGDKDNNQYDDGKTQDTGNQTQSGKLANGKDATVANVQAILDQIKREYPEGTSWGNDKTPGTNYYKDGPKTGSDPGRDVSDGIRKFGAVDLKYACGGWAAMVSERIFGKNGAPCREITDFSKVRPGDIVLRITDGHLSHVGIALSYTPAYTEYGTNISARIYTCDGNLGGTNGKIGGTVTWNYPNTLSSNRTTFRVLTRYPD